MLSHYQAQRSQDSDADTKCLELQNIVGGKISNCLLLIVTHTFFLFQVAWVQVKSQTILSVQTVVITRDERMKVTHSNRKDWFLHLKKVQFDDSGYYMCQINTTPMIHQLLYLEVVGNMYSIDLSD